MSRYLELLANQRPFPFNVDESLRTMFSCNFSALAEAPTADWEGEILKVIVDAGLAVKPNPPSVVGNIWIGPAATIPAGDGPFIQIIDTGGRPPDYTHDGAKYERLSCQIVVRSKSFAAGRTRALAIWRALDGKRNVTLAA